MSIVRITVRTFQNEDHANLFLIGAKSVISEDNKSGLKLNSKIIKIQIRKIKSQVFGNMMMKST